jgi:hypothetical protein
MIESSERYEVKKPRWGLFDSGWWFTVAGTGVAIVVMVIPSIIERPLWQRVLATFVIVLLTPLLASGILYFNRRLLYTRARLIAYDLLLTGYKSLYGEWEHLKHQLAKATETIRLLVSFPGERQVFGLGRVQTFRNKLYIQVRKREDVELAIGQPIIIVDTFDGYYMGQFRVLQDEDNCYVAIEDGDIDSVWRGYIRDSGQSEMDPPPGSVAILKIKDAVNNV